MLPQVTASLDGLYATSLGKIADGKAKSDGITVGAAAAAVMLADRLDDGRNGTRSWWTSAPTRASGAPCRR